MWGAPAPQLMGIVGSKYMTTVDEQDEKLYYGALQNPWLAVNIMSNYAILMKTMKVYTAMMAAYFDVLNERGIHPRDADKRTSRNIAMMHYLFSILFEYERGVDCSDAKGVDCIFLKELIAVYKASGFYEAYLNYVAQYQVKNKMHPAYGRVSGGGIAGGTPHCMMYIVMFAIMILAQVQSITIDLRDSFFKRVEIDFKVYNQTAPEAISADTYMQMLLPLLLPMQNLYGSCVFNAVSYSNMPDVIEDVYENILTNNYDVMQALTAFTFPKSTRPSFVVHGAYFDLIRALSFEGIRSHAKRVYSGLIQIYENDEPATHSNTTSYMNKNSYMTLIKDAFVPNIPAQNAHYDHYISTIKNKLHLSNLAHNTTLDVSKSPLIITFVGSWVTGLGGHAFNILYNTASDTLCIFDMNSINYLHNSTAIDQTTNVFTTHDVNILSPVYFSEKGFWDGSEFEHYPAFDKLNAYANDTDLFTLYVTKMYNYTGTNTTKDYRIKIDDIYLLNQSIPLSATNNFNGWGCATLSGCGKSAIAMFETYYKILHRHREYVETLFAPGMMLGLQVLSDAIEQRANLNTIPAVKETMTNIDWHLSKLKNFQKHGFNPMSAAKKSAIGGRRRHRTKQCRCTKQKKCITKRRRRKTP